jgi:hypothetical protein
MDFPALKQDDLTHIMAEVNRSVNRISAEIFSAT